MFDTVALLELLGTVDPEELSLHPLVLQQLHAVLLVETDELNLLVLLLDIIIAVNFIWHAIIIYFKLLCRKIMCLICTVGQIHRLQTEIDILHRAVHVLQNRLVYLRDVTEWVVGCVQLGCVALISWM